MCLSPARGLHPFVFHFIHPRHRNKGLLATRDLESGSADYHTIDYTPLARVIFVYVVKKIPERVM